MSPKLKPLLLPQIIENRSYPKNHEHHASLTKSVCDGDLTHVYSSATTNSSSSDIASPLTPTFSARHMRYSSSTSSLELPSHLQEPPASPIYQHHHQQPSKPQPQQLQYLSQLPQSAVKPAKRSLPDVEEEPFERAEEHEFAPTSHFGLYSCLCDRPCEHRTSTGSIFPGDFITDGEIDYDAGFMSDSDIGTEAQWSGRQRTSSDAPFHALTTRLGSHFSNNINRWRSTRRPNLISSPTTEVSFETAMPHGHSSRSSSISASVNARGCSFDGSAANTPQPTSYFPSAEVMERQSSESACLTTEERMNLERDRAQATTPLLPPLMTRLPSERQHESPLQSPIVATSATNTEVQTSPTVSTYAPRPSLSSKPSLSSFRFGGSGTDLPLPLPAMVQDHDEWSDRLGHANFTITPQPYEPEIIAPETLTRFREDWELAKVNYTKHLVRTGENYGQTSNIYALTEAKWAETEDRWRSIHEGLIRQTMVFHSAPVSASNSRSRSRGRDRGRSRAGSATFIRGRAAVSADVSPDMHNWPRLDAAAPNAITQMLDAGDKFPNRGDEDIVGPMVRDEVMLRTHSEERKTSRFWKTLVEKVGIKK